MIDAVISALVTLVAFLCLGTSVMAQSDYPLVFDSPAKLKPYGIVLLLDADLQTKNLHYPTRCYYYGDGGWDISISDDLLKHYQSQGFSRRSACMALVSGIRFNPETGARLATYILIDPKLIKNGAPADAGASSDELPLSLPRCFNRGLPYSDCAWNYDPMTGVHLPASEVKKFREIGARIEKFLSDPRTRRNFSYMKDDSPYTKGEIMVGAARSVDSTVVGEDSAASFYDYSGEFPKGFGYALYADGAAGPDASPEVVKAAINRNRPKPQVDPKALMQIWNTGTH